MKPRKWIITACLIVIAVSGGMYIAKQSLERNRNLEELLIAYVSPVVGSTFEVEKLRIGFFSVALAGVKIVIPLQSFALNVQDIKIGLSFFKLIISRGDFTKSINKIIFVNPIIEVFSPRTGSTQRQDTPRHTPFAIGSFPIKQILVKNCTVLLRDPEGDKIVVGEQLSGQLWGDKLGLNFELKGKLASRTRNLFLAGALSENKKQQHISVRLDRAGIHKPIQWQNISISEGKLDGVCEFSFSDTTFPFNIDANGWLNIQKGVGRIKGIEKDIKGVNLKLRLARNVIAVDTLTAQWNGIKAFVKCSTGLSSLQESWFLLRFNNVKPALFTGNLPEPLKSNITGTGWAEIEATKIKNSKRFTADLSAGGFTIAEHSISRISGKCNFGKESIKVDTIRFEYPGLKGGLNGVIDFEKKPFAYSFNVALSSDAENFLPDLKGRMAISGEVHGLGKDSKLNLLLKGSKIVYNNVKLGNPCIGVTSKGNTFHFSSKKRMGDLFSFNGTVDNSNVKQPFIDFDAVLYKNFLSNLFINLHDDFLKSFTSINFEAKVKGKLPNPEIAGHLKFKGDKLSGACGITFTRTDETEPYSWQLTGDKSSISDTLFPLSASGKLTEDAIVITKLMAMDGISGSGNIQTREKGLVDLEIICEDVSLTRMNAFISADQRLIKRGFLSGTIRIDGDINTPKTYSQLNIREFNLAGMSSLEADAVLTSSGNKYTILPFVIRKDKKVILAVDTVSNKKHIRLSGSFKNIDIGDLVGNALPDDYTLQGFISGEFYASKSGWPIRVNMHSKRIKLNSWKLDSVTAFLKMSQKEIIIEKITAADSSRSQLSAGAIVPWPFLSNTEGETDTMHASLKAKGDLFSSLEHNVESPIGGNGKGEIFIDYSVTSEGWHFHKAEVMIQQGLLKIKPFVPDNVKDVTLTMNLDNQQKLHVSLAGRINRRPVSVISSHVIPKGFEPLMFGPVNCGVLQMNTPQKGIDVFVLGFMERKKGYTADIDFASRKPFNAFTISGPSDKPKITGTWVIRNVEFTFPLVEDAPIPENIIWDMDLVAGDRKVVYFYNIGGKKRRLIRFTECFLDPSSTIVKVRGSFSDGSFRVLGKMRSYRGYVFYGRNFDRNLKAGLDFVPQKTEDGREYDNMPVIWGTAEAFSDTSRFDRIKITLLTRNKKTGALQERDRFNEVTFRVSSDFEEIPGEAEMEFYHEAGLEFITFRKAGKKAGEMVSSFGDQYMNRYLLQRIERRLARRLGLDVVSLETSIASNYFNYFYNNSEHLGDLTRKWDYLAFANIGVTVGRYFLQDKVFLKWRTELIPNDFVLIPEHNIGFEYQPFEYFWVDFNYGFYKDENVVVNNPKFLMQLRVPIGKFRKTFDF